MTSDGVPAGSAEAKLVLVELPPDDQLIAVTMTREETLLVTLGELGTLVGQHVADAAQLRSLVEDTDAHHPALRAWFSVREGQEYVSFTVRST